jgi:hypothetical protein
MMSIVPARPGTQKLWITSVKLSSNTTLRPPLWRRAASQDEDNDHYCSDNFRANRERQRRRRRRPGLDAKRRQRRLPCAAAGEQKHHCGGLDFQRF